MFCALLVEIKTIYKIHGTYIKIAETQQAKLRKIYKNTKLKLLKTNVAILYNKICRAKLRNFSDVQLWNALRMIQMYRNM
jgi:hypothetical protein